MWRLLERGGPLASGGYWETGGFAGEEGAGRNLLSSGELQESGGGMGACPPKIWQSLLSKYLLCLRNMEAKPRPEPELGEDSLLFLSLQGFFSTKILGGRAKWGKEKGSQRHCQFLTAGFPPRGSLN